MKFLVVSDLHGSALYAEKIAEVFNQGGFDRILFLGDMLYHGPRNPLPVGHDPMKAAEILSALKDKITAVRGNCDAEVDKMVTGIDVLQESCTIINEGRKIFATHGHIYSEDQLPALSENDVFLYGHVHLPIAKKEKGIYILNPGSITLPKQGNPNSYGILDENGFVIKTLEHVIIKEIQFID